MGDIIFWGIIRTAVAIPVLWVLFYYIEYEVWWIIAVFTAYGFVIHPAIVKYKEFRESNDNVVNDTICGQCKHFDESAVLCTLYDEHPREDFIPCGGADWEPK